ncbi:hypothetical protein Tco_0737951 [Tanacetum coccineum]
MMSTEFRLKREDAESAYEVAKDKECTVMRLEEMKFLAISTKDLSENDTYSDVTILFDVNGVMKPCALNVKSEINNNNIQSRHGRVTKAS